MNNLSPVTAVALTLSCLILASTLPAQETTEKKIIPITVHLLGDEDGAAADPEAIDRWISQASEQFANAGVAFKGEIVREKVPSADVNSARTGSVLGFQYQALLVNRDAVIGFTCFPPLGPDWCRSSASLGLPPRIVTF